MFVRQPHDRGRQLQRGFLTFNALRNPRGEGTRERNVGTVRQRSGPHIRSGDIPLRPATRSGRRVSFSGVRTRRRRGCRVRLISVRLGRRVVPHRHDHRDSSLACHHRGDFVRDAWARTRAHANRRHPQRARLHHWRAALRLRAARRFVRSGTNARAGGRRRGNIVVLLAQRHGRRAFVRSRLYAGSSAESGPRHVHVHHAAARPRIRRARRADGGRGGDIFLPHDC